MHILHVHTTYYPFLSGPTIHITDIAKHVFSIKNHSVVSFDRNDENKETTEYQGIPIQRFDKIDRMDFNRLFHFGFQEANQTIRDFVAYYRSLRPTCVALHFVGYLPQFIRLAVPEARIVFMPFGFREEEMLPQLDSKGVKIVLFDPHCYENIHSYGIKSSRIELVEPPIDTDLFRPITGIRNPQRLLYVGRIHPWKRLTEFIRAAANLFYDYTSLHFHIVGDTNPTYARKQTHNELQRIQNTAKELGIEDRIVFRGKMEGQDLIREYSEASIHVLPSIGERRNTATQEAITMGLHCINTNVQPWDWPEFTPTGECLIHSIDSIEEFDPVIRKLLESNGRPNHREYVQNHWSWSRWKQDYERIFSEW